MSEFKIGDIIKWKGPDSWGWTGLKGEIVNVRKANPNYHNYYYDVKVLEVPEKHHNTELKHTKVGDIINGIYGRSDLMVKVRKSRAPKRSCTPKRRFLSLIK